MKKIFKFFGAFIVLLMSFLYTEKAATIVKNVDEIMIKIKEIYLIKKKEPVQAKILENTIIPGINGFEVDIGKSYRKMRYSGKYNDNLLEYKTLYVTNLLSNNKDKVIISGNNQKKQVSLIFILNDEEYIDNLIRLDKKSDISIFISGNFAENNIKNLNQLSFRKSILGTIGYNYEYNIPDYVWLDSVVKSISNTENSYCLSLKKESPKECVKFNNFSIYGNPITNSFLTKTKEQLGSGKILIYNVNNSLLNEIDSILNFVNSKGYEIVKIDKLLKE